MTDDTSTSSRQKRVDQYLLMANIGTVAAVIAPFTYISMLYSFESFRETQNAAPTVAWVLAAVVGFICQLYTIFHLFFRRKTDEFTHAMWHSGATFAFFATITWLMIGGWAEDVIVIALASSPEEYSEPRSDTVERLSIYVSLAAFFVGFQFKRIKGGI